MNSARRLSSKLAVAATFAATVCLLPALTQSGRTFSPVGEIRAQFSNRAPFLPLWSGHALLQVDNNYSPEPVIYTIDKDGNRQDIPFTVLKAVRIGIWAASAGRDGALALLASALSDDSRGALLLTWISPDRTQRTITRIDRPYVPECIALAADGIIWTAGESEGHDSKAPIVRRFDTSGRELGSYVPRDMVRGRHPTEHSYLVSSRDRVGWYTEGNEYIEFAFDGTLMNRFPGVPPASDVLTEAAALSDDNDVVICQFNSNTHTHQVHALDRGRRAWVPVTFTGTNTAPLVSGFEGTTLVTIPDQWKVMRFYREASPTKTP